MNYEEYLNFLLDIKIAVQKEEKKDIIYVTKHQLTDPVGRLIIELQEYLNTPLKQLIPKDWYNVGYILAQYFGKEGVQMIYNKNYRWDKWEKK